MEIVRASCPSRVGAQGIVLRESRETLQLVTEDDRVIVVPKAGAVFRIELPVCSRREGGGREGGDGGRKGGGRLEGARHLEATIFGSHFRFAAFERSKRKWKPQATIKLRSDAARTN